MKKHNFLPHPTDFGSEARQTKTWKEATVRDLHLPAVVSVTEASPCGEAVSKMQKGGFDQLPVVNETGALRGLITLGITHHSPSLTPGNILSYASSGKATMKSPVSQVMYDFSRLRASPPDSPRLKALVSPTKLEIRPASRGNPAEKHKVLKKGDKFWEITMDTKLDTLNRFFFDKYPVALVTERKNGGGLDVVGVVTKVDLLGFLLQIGGIDGESQ
jgi:cystathionine beta-synthase